MPDGTIDSAYFADEFDDEALTAACLESGGPLSALDGVQPNMSVRNLVRIGHIISLEG